MQMIPPPASIRRDIERAAIMSSDETHGEASTEVADDIHISKNDPELIMDEETGEADPDVLKDLEKERSCVFEERLETGKARRVEGNDAFKDGDLSLAMRCYKKSLYHSRFDELQYNYELMDEHRGLVDQETDPVYLNMAAVELKTEDWDSAVRHCGEVLKRDTGNTKALFRRSKAYQGKGWWEEATQDMLKCTTLAPEVRTRFRFT
jgi:tetratricopeptide (TPR) repeat protein